MQFDLTLAATGIGSMPNLNADEACEQILNMFPELPFWPQLVKLTPEENMIIQVTEELPSLEIDLSNQKVLYKKEIDRYKAFSLFYEKYLSERLDHFAISEKFARGFHILLEKIKGNRRFGCRYIKGQVVGPITFGGGIEGPDGKPILYDAEMMDIVKKGLAMKVLWQAQKIKELDRRPVIFLDEPYLSGFGSAFVPIERQTVMSTLNETIEEIKKRGNILIGIHCCGNTDWPMILQTKVDVVSFDAYGFVDYFVIYPVEIRDFLNRGGVIAWGIVPTTQFTGAETAVALLNRLDKAIEKLVENGVEKETILKNSILTPSCGMGFMAYGDSQKALSLLAEVSEASREKYGIYG